MPRQLQSVVIPRGAVVPLLVSCRRQNYQGDVSLSVAGLPDGVTFDSRSIESGSHVGVGLFRAAANAPPGISLARLMGRSEMVKGSVYGVLSQEVGLVFGQPRKTVYHSVDLGHIPIQVVEEAPFQIEARSRPFRSFNKVSLIYRSRFIAIQSLAGISSCQWYKHRLGFAARKVT